MCRQKQKAEFNKIKFITYYSNVEDTLKRTASPAAINVINYISNAIVANGFNLEIISPSWVINDDSKTIYKMRKTKLDKKICLINAPSIGGKSMIRNTLKKAISRIWIICYLLKHVKKGETIIAYHQPTLMFPLNILKLIKKPKLIVVTEELYSDISKFNYLSKNKEINFLKKADAYIFPTLLLSERINTADKSFVIVHGTYTSEAPRNLKYKDGLIHVVYAGTFNPFKGATIAVEAAEYLDERFHIHIIGFGSDQEKEELLTKISSVKKRTKCKITYDGLKTGEDYISFLQSCDIGLSTQNPSASFNDTSFPSKILSYLSNGLRVVSIRIKAIETSAVSDILYYYDSSDPKEVANTIKSVDLSKPYDSRKKIDMLNIRFSKDLGKIIGESLHVK